MKNIAVIPARSGSKGLKDKNIKFLKGKPLLVYAIEAALRSEEYDVVHVSTDSEIYAKIAVEHGADVPFLRTDELSNDTATTWDVVRYVLEQYQKIGKEFGTLTVLQPTSPLRTSSDIKNAYKLFREKAANTVVSVCEMDHSPLWSNVLPPDCCMNNFLNHLASGPRQDLPMYYRINGAIYIVKTETLLQNKEIYDERSFAYIMSKNRSIDIDDEWDFDMAEFIMNKAVTGENM